MSESRVVTMENGESVDFGQRANIVVKHKVVENGFTVNFHLFNGKTLTYTYEGDSQDKLLYEMAAFGAAAKVKGSCSGTLDEIAVIIQNKINEFKDGLFVTRGSGAATKLNLTLTQEAYARLNNLDISSQDGIAEVKEIFDAMTDQEKKTLMKSPAFKKEFLLLKLEAVEAEEAELTD